MKRLILIGICGGSLALYAAPQPALRVQQNRFNDRLQMQQRELQLRQQNRTPSQPALIQPARSDVRQNPTPQERQRIDLENHQKEQLLRQQQIAQPPAQNDPPKPEKR